MQSLISAAFLILSVLSLVNAASFLERRQTVFGTIAPANGSTIVPGSSFSFEYSPTNICHNGYSPITVYLSVSPPDIADITTSGELADGSFVFHFGDWVIANFVSLPPMNPPPSTLTAPVLDTVNDGTTLYFSVVEEYSGCPPKYDEPPFGLDTTTVVYA